MSIALQSAGAPLFPAKGGDAAIQRSGGPVPR